MFFHALDISKIVLSFQNFKLDFPLDCPDGMCGYDCLFTCLCNTTVTGFRKINNTCPYGCAGRARKVSDRCEYGEWFACINICSGKTQVHDAKYFCTMQYNKLTNKKYSPYSIT